jgi:hypothetical protein
MSSEAIISDVERVMRLGGYAETLVRDGTTILKDNISWHMPFLSANMTPSQLEGVVRTLRSGGSEDLIAVHNNAVVTDPYKGEKLA